MFRCIRIAILCFLALNSYQLTIVAGQRLDAARCASDGTDSGCVAVSPHGNAIELLGVVRMDEEPPTAWTADGTKIDLPEIWPDVVSAVGQRPTHGFVLKCREFRKGQNLGWRLTGKWATPKLSDGVSGIVTVSTRLPEGRTTDIRIGILDPWGPWQRVEEDGSMGDPVDVLGVARDLYSHVKSVEVLAGGRGALRTGFVLNGIVGNEEAADYGEYEVVAVDSEGKRHKRRGVGIWNGGQVPYFELSQEEISFFEYRMRPYLHWLTFKEVALQPGMHSNVEVCVSDAGLSSD